MKRGNDMIRKMISSDFDNVYKLVCDLEETEFDPYKMNEIMKELNKTHDIFVFEEEKKILGYLDLKIEYQMHHCGKVAEVIEFCVDPNYRSKKIGAQLFEYAKKYAKNKDCVVLDLTTNQKRHRAHKFYEAHGMNQTHYKYTFDLTKEDL